MLTHSISDEIEQKIFGKWRRHFPIEQNEPEILPRPRFPTLHLLLSLAPGVHDFETRLLSLTHFCVYTLVIALTVGGAGWGASWTTDGTNPALKGELLAFGTVIHNKSTINFSQLNN